MTPEEVRSARGWVAQRKRTSGRAAQLDDWQLLPALDVCDVEPKLAAAGVTTRRSLGSPNSLSLPVPERCISPGRVIRTVDTEQ
jgi:hypothetical protein